MKKLALLMGCAALAYNPETCPTVTVKGQDGNPLRINKDDYDADPEAWELISDETSAAVAPVAPVEPVAAPVAPAAPTPAPAAPMVVSKIGKGADARFFVTDMEKNKIAGVAGIDEAGYADEGSAWGAIQAVATNG